MRPKLIDILLAMSLCGFYGCASKPIDTAAAKQPAVDQNREQPPAVGQNREQMPAQSSAIADKPREIQTVTPKVKPGNDVVVRPEIASNKETLKTSAKNETTEGRPSEMKVANGFDRNPYLSSILRPLLPPHTSVMNAATGFKNQKQFIAAVHLSRNLDIPFDQIKTRMTGEHRVSLNDSLRDLRPEMTKSLAKAEVNKAEHQAKEDESRAKDDAKKAAAHDKPGTNTKS